MAMLYAVVDRDSRVLLARSSRAGAGRPAEDVALLGMFVAYSDSVGCSLDGFSAADCQIRFSRLLSTFQCPHLCMVSEADRHPLQAGLKALVKDVDSDQAALVAHGMVLSATSQWSWLDPLEAGLLTYLVPAFAPTGMSDVPIYLPISSPTTPVRLLVAELAPGVRLVMLAGKDLPLDNLPFLVSSHLQPVKDTITKVAEAAQKVAESIGQAGSQMPTLVLQHQPAAIATTFYPSANALHADKANTGQSLSAFNGIVAAAPANPPPLSPLA
ncbi:hypothetical protein WJX74_009928 [Apatococcus lobatus]|uniref:FUZ/MON1/HPS1 second Longin domain-containing protein n=1 Tax=Apatococcus lobatus TaxID=904363 RepID=A0AAW1QZH4_9CHLO